MDIDETLNINPVLLEKYISPKTRAIIVQHTFGIPAKIELIKKITQKYKLILIEDCAHSLGGYYQGKKIGSWGDAAFFSFGRDKIISSVFGGLCILSQRHENLGLKLKNIQLSFPEPGHFWIFQQLLHPVAFAVILRSYNYYLGKIILVVLQKLNLLSKPVYKEEYTGGKPDIFPARYANGLAILLLKQLKKLSVYNSKRQDNAEYYVTHLKRTESFTIPRIITGAVYLRFNILSSQSGLIRTAAKKAGILLGNWYSHVIDPKEVNLPNVGYKNGSCPVAEKTAKLVINLPTYPRLITEELNRIVSIVNRYAD
jgi:perosamine synthetase